MDSSLEFRGLVFWVLVLLSVFKIPTSYANQSESAGKAVSVSGIVFVRNDTTGVSQRQLKPGDVISQGDTINTTAQGAAKLLMADQSIMDIGSSSLFRVDQFQQRSGLDRQVLISVASGKIRGSVTQPVGPRGRFNIRTRSAIMGVRGTEFIVATGPSVGATEGAPAGLPGTPNQPPQFQTQITVVHGTVDVQNTNVIPGGVPQTFRLTEGQQMTAVNRPPGEGPARDIASAQPKVVTLSQHELKETAKEARVEDKTFKQAINLDVPKGERPDGPRGLSTLTAVQTSLPRPGALPPPIRFGEIGTPGTTFAPAPPPPPRLAGIPVRVQVTFRK